ncbi:hypothetical protein RIR_e49411_A0A2N0NJ35_9GLOM [Rhizophagus irregularis DAOM 181602=DAOM 197198]|nr:hypothetical protein RIR_e49411_A0A2N0NJ35_9GLOM [Rhizophagus irregularis DAOM 181602=DAOM 197198]
MSADQARLHLLGKKRENAPISKANNSQTDLEKIIGKPFSLDEFTEGSSKVRITKTNIQLSKKQKVAKEIKNIDKTLGGINKLTILAEIGLMFRKLGAS